MFLNICNTKVINPGETAVSFLFFALPDAPARIATTFLHPWSIAAEQRLHRQERPLTSRLELVQNGVCHFNESTVKLEVQPHTVFLRPFRKVLTYGAVFHHYNKWSKAGEWKSLWIDVGQAPHGIGHVRR